MIIIFVFFVCITARDRERVNNLYGIIPNLVSGCIMVSTCGHNNLKSTVLRLTRGLHTGNMFYNIT